MRDFWRGEPATLGEFAARLTGSADLYEHDRPPPVASINFVTCHDGFTLRDLVSYNDKHNEANGEDNRTARATTGPGTAASRARPTTRRSSTLRAQQRRNFLATLFLSQGVPMLRTATSSAAPSAATTTATARTTS